MRHNQTRAEAGPRRRGRSLTGISSVGRHDRFASRVAATATDPQEAEDKTFILAATPALAGSRREWRCSWVWIILAVIANHNSHGAASGRIRYFTRRSPCPAPFLFVGSPRPWA